MTNAPLTRKTHVIRIVGTNRAGDVLQDLWVDVERMDVAKNVLSDENYQGSQRKFRWMDNPDGDEYEVDGNPIRKTKILKVCDPSSDDIDDPDEWIPVRIVTSMKLVHSANNYQGRVERLLNNELNESRIVEKRRVLHYDTSIDDEAQAAFDADPSRKVYVVAGDRYTRDNSTKDEDQYVETEVVKFLKQRGGNAQTTNMPAVDDQGKQTKLLNEYLIEESEPAKLDEQGANGFNPPYRLDPYQNIININLGGLAVEFFDGGSSE
jgi:hypothetical protein